MPTKTCTLYFRIDGNRTERVTGGAKSPSYWLQCSFIAKVLSPIVLVFGGAASTICTSLRAQEDTHSFEFSGLALTVPLPLQVDLVSSPELVRWPIVADFDEANRLVVAESGGVSRPIEEHNKRALHRVVRLIDADGDGKFDRRLLAADKLPFSEGVLCVGNDILVSAPPNIWRLIDGDGDGVCENREVWFDGQTITGCANDLHGPYRGHDGWIYWCKGAFAEQTHALYGNQKLTTSAAHIFRRKPEGGPIEPVMTGGMDNPVEVAITLEGERFFTSTFLQHPGDGKRDGIAHAVYGGVYGKDHGVINGHLRTGELMPIMTHLGPAAPSGLISLESKQLLNNLGTLADNSIARHLVAAQFNLQRVTLHQLVAVGAGFTTINHDLLVGNRIDFHPTDVIEDSDGSLLILDTGGWYNLCCPSSHVDQNQALGGIYRLSSALTRSATDRHGEKLNWEAMTIGELATRLADPRLAVRRRAMNVLVNSGSPCVESLAGILADASVNVDTKLACIWILCRVGDESSMGVVAKSLQSPLQSVRHAAAHAISVHRWTAACEDLKSIVVSDNAASVRRVAAEALGRMGKGHATQSLMRSMMHASEDRILEHSLLFAMMELNDRTAVEAFLDSSEPSQIRAAMIVLEQLGASEKLTAARIGKFVQSDSHDVRMTAIQIAAKHPTWAPESIDLLRLLGKSAMGGNQNDRSALLELLRGWAGQSIVQDYLAEWLKAAPTMTQSDQVNLLECLRASGMKLSPSLSPLVAHWMESSEAAFQMQLADWLLESPIDGEGHADISKALMAIANSRRDQPSDVVRLLAAMPASMKSSSPEHAALVIDYLLNSENSHAVASIALERINLDKSHAGVLLEHLGQIAPRQLLSVMSSIAAIGDDSIDSELLARLLKIPAAGTLPSDAVTNLYRNRGDELKALVASTLSQIHRPSAEIESTVSQKLATLPEGDSARGYQVFRNSKAVCNACHRVAYVGGTIGPELTHIGSTRTRRDLLEAVLFPNARLEQSYQSTRVLTVDGQVFNGLVQSENAEELKLAIAADRTISLPLNDIELRSPSEVSIMPAGLEQILSQQDLADLLAFLEASK